MGHSLEDGAWGDGRNETIKRTSRCGCKVVGESDRCKRFDPYLGVSFIVLSDVSRSYPFGTIVSSLFSAVLEQLSDIFR